MTIYHNIILYRFHEILDVSFDVRLTQRTGFKAGCLGQSDSSSGGAMNSTAGYRRSLCLAYEQRCIECISFLNI